MSITDGDLQIALRTIMEPGPAAGPARFEANLAYARWLEQFNLGLKPMCCEGYVSFTFPLERKIRENSELLEKVIQKLQKLQYKPVFTITPEGRYSTRRVEYRSYFDVRLLWSSPSDTPAHVMPEHVSGTDLDYMLEFLIP